jgi:hypothetical protein
MCDISGDRRAEVAGDTIVDIKIIKTDGTLMDVRRGEEKLKQAGLTLQRHASIVETIGHWRDKTSVVTGTAVTMHRF